MVLEPDGLFHGERLKKCSDLARLYYPYLMAASNGFARLELNYERVMDRGLNNFEKPLSREAFFAIIREYRDNYLMFLYKAKNQYWGQFVTDSKYLPRHKTAKDRQSPEPPIEKYVEFQEAYELSKTTVPADLENFGEVPEVVLRPSQTFQNSSENFGEFPRGVGVGGGVGEGGGKPAGGFSAVDAVSQVLIRMKLSGDDMRKLVVSALDLTMAERKCDGLEAGKYISDRWDEYSKATIRGKKGKKGFLQESEYLKPNSEWGFSQDGPRPVAVPQRKASESW